MESVRYSNDFRVESQWFFHVPYKGDMGRSGRKGRILTYIPKTFPVNKLCTHLYSVMYFYFHKNVFADTKR